MTWNVILVTSRDVNRVPESRDPKKLPEPGFQTTRKLPENLMLQKELVTYKFLLQHHV